MALDAVARKRHQEETIPGYYSRKIRQLPEYVDARRSALVRLVRRQDNDLIAREGGVLNERVREELRIVIRSVKRSDLMVLILVDPNDQRPSFGGDRPLTYGRVKPNSSRLVSLRDRSGNRRI